jgi:hypothetical protein
MMQNVNGNVKETFVPEEINKITFILFAEFLGYESAFVEWAEDICNGEKVDDFKKILIERDADYIFKKMTEEYSLDEIRNWYDEFYDVILKEYDETAKGMDESIITT